MKSTKSLRHLDTPNATPTPATNRLGEMLPRKPKQNCHYYFRQAEEVANAKTDLVALATATPT
jgi:hypothetical protein